MDTEIHPHLMSDLTFEQALQRLEGIVAQLERDDVDLDASLRAYEEGITLARYCSDQLNSAELRIQNLKIEEQ